MPLEAADGLVLSKNWRVGGVNFCGNGTVSHLTKYGREKPASYWLLKLVMASNRRSNSSILVGCALAIQVLLSWWALAPVVLVHRS